MRSFFSGGGGGGLVLHFWCSCPPSPPLRTPLFDAPAVQLQGGSFLQPASPELSVQRWSFSAFAMKQFLPWLIRWAVK